MYGVCVCVCVCVCVRACVRACVCVCVRARARAWTISQRFVEIGPPKTTTNRTELFPSCTRPANAHHKTLYGAAVLYIHATFQGKSFLSVRDSEISDALTWQ